MLIDEIRVKNDEDLFIIGGDLNARVGDQDLMPSEIFEESSLYETIISSDRLINQRGSLVIDFMSTNDFLLVNGRSTSGRPARPTFTSDIGKSVIDLVWVSVMGLRWIKDLRIVLEPTLFDHFPVELKLWCENSTESQTVDEIENLTASHTGIRCVSFSNN